jgi:transcriptional regulator with XRE-family HTH domain
MPAGATFPVFGSGARAAEMNATFNPAMMTLAKESAGLTQAAIAQHAGVSQSLMSKIENGFETPSRDFLTKPQRLRGVPVQFSSKKR